MAGRAGVTSEPSPSHPAAPDKSASVLDAALCLHPSAPRHPARVSAVASCYGSEAQAQLYGFVEDMAPPMLELVADGFTSAPGAGQVPSLRLGGGGRGRSGAVGRWEAGGGGMGQRRGKAGPLVGCIPGGGAPADPVTGCPRGRPGPRSGSSPLRRGAASGVGGGEPKPGSNSRRLRLRGPGAASAEHTPRRIGYKPWAPQRVCHEQRPLDQAHTFGRQGCGSCLWHLSLQSKDAASSSRRQVRAWVQTRLPRFPSLRGFRATNAVGPPVLGPWHVPRNSPKPVSTRCARPAATASENPSGCHLIQAPFCLKPGLFQCRGGGGGN